MKEGRIPLDVEAVNQPRTLFKPGSWLAKIDFINHLVLFNNVLITVLSETAGGKTSFSTLLQNNLDLQIKSISMKINPPCDRDSIINDIATQFHLNNDAQTNIASIVAQVNERKAHVLLIIDDAHHLPESLIKEITLAIKKQENFGFFHVCLVSDYSIVATLNSLVAEQFNNLIHTIELGALSESETRTYVLQRAMNAGLINKPLSDVQIKQFYQLTKGCLSKINGNLESFILKCSRQKKSNKMLLLKRTSMAVIGVVAAGLSFMYVDSNYDLMGKRTLIPSEKMSESFIESAHNGTKTVTEQSVREEQLISYIASWQDFSTRQLVHYALPKKQILEGIDEEEELNSNTVALVDKVVVIPTVKPRKFVAESLTPSDPIAQVPLESKLVNIAVASQDKPVNKPVIKLAADRYTIQLAASHNLNDIHRFRKNNNLMDKTLVKQFTNAKGTWYILTLGEYPSRNTAQSSAKTLSGKLTKLNPWVRAMSGLSNVG